MLLNKTPELAGLDRVAISVRRAEEAAAFAASYSQTGANDEAREWASRSRDHSSAALIALEGVGARIPQIESDEPVVSTVPLHLLSTPATRRLVEALEAAAAAGLAVDDERAREGVGALLAELAYKWRGDVFGASGRD